MAESISNGFVAALPMYDWPEVRYETDALWNALADALHAHGLEPPARLSRRRGPQALWRDPRLLLGQTCGLPYVRDLRQTVHMVATPCYEAAGCDGPLYRSFVVTRAGEGVRSLDDLRGQRVAYNASHSQSGYAALRAVIAPLAGGGVFFRETLKTGSHRASLKAVADGHADVCAVDAVCWALAGRHDPAVIRRLAVIAETPATPGLPMICSGARDRSERRRIRKAAMEVLQHGLSGRVRDALFLTGAERLPPAAYNCIVAMERDALDKGYPTLQ